VKIRCVKAVFTLRCVNCRTMSYDIVRSVNTA